MKKINIKFVGGSLLILTIAGSTSCKKLDVLPLSMITTANYGTSAVQIEAEYTGAMNFLWDRYGGYAVAGDRTPDITFVNDDQLNGGDLTVAQDLADPYWLMHYRAITNINNALNAIKSGRIQDETAATIEILTAEGKFLQAFNYFNLVRIFGDVPLITEDSDPADFARAKSPVKDVYTLIVSDLQYAKDKLPESWAGAPGKPTKGAAGSLLAKVYLTMAGYPLNDPTNYAKAADAALAVINSGTYDLVRGCENVFLTANKYSKEMIFAFNTTVDHKGSVARGWAPMEYADKSGWDACQVDTAFEHRWPPQPRKDAYLYLTLDGKKGSEWYTTALQSHVPYCKKFFYYMSLADYNAPISTQNFPILRYADVLLIYAEATNMANGSPTQAACNAINRVIDRGNAYEVNPKHPLLKPTMSKEDFDKAVIQERSWELCFEFPDRWFDITRKRILKEVSAPYPNKVAHLTDDHIYVFPIPQNDLKLDKALVQNPGYPTP